MVATTTELLTPSDSAWTLATPWVPESRSSPSNSWAYPSRASSIRVVALRFTTLFTKAARQPYLHHRGKLNTILAEPELDRLTLVWSTVLDCGRDVDHIDATRVIEKEIVA